MSQHRLVLNAVLTVALLGAAMLDVAVADDVTARLRTCAAETNDAARLRCYDNEMRRLSASPAASVPVPASAAVASVAAAPSAPAIAAVPASPPKNPEEEFGFRGSAARAEVNRREEQSNAVDRLETEVTAVSKRPYGELVVTLANGQVWAQKAPEQGIRVSVGDQIAIKRASLGSFLLATVDGRTTRVTRVK